jgi:hypothetical protein
MKPTPDYIFEEALLLSKEDRAALIDRLLASIDHGIDPAIEAAHIAECEARMATQLRAEEDASRQGKAEPRPAQPYPPGE